MGTEYDVIIAGAGPAGATAAYWLGRSGRRVLILEKQRLPRYKTCGGAIPISELGLLPFDVGALVEVKVEHIRYAFDGHNDVLQTLPPPGVAMVTRERFDAFLVAQAKADVRDGVGVKGVVEDATGVTVTTSAGDNLRAHYLVGADGASSRVAHSLGLRRRPMLAGAVEVEIPAPDHVMSRFRNTVQIKLGSLPYGYGWVFPKADHLSVGAGALPHRHMDLKAALGWELRQLGLDVGNARVHGHPVPLYWRHEQCHGRWTVLAGDAAGLVDGLIGEGIRYAIRSGKLAAESILSDDIDGYSASIQRELGNDLIWARFCGWWLHHLVDVCYRFAVPNPRLTCLLAEILAGRQSYRDMFFGFPRLMIEQMMRRPLSPNTI